VFYIRNRALEKGQWGSGVAWLGKPGRVFSHINFTSSTLAVEAKKNICILTKNESFILVALGNTLRRRASFLISSRINKNQQTSLFI
jgi:hypothetical protein